MYNFFEAQMAHESATDPQYGHIPHQSILAKIWKQGVQICYLKNRVSTNI